MNQRFVEATYIKREVGVTPYGERKEVWVEDSYPIEIIIYYAVNGATATSNDVETTAYSVVALTEDNRPNEQDKIKYSGKTYLIDHMIPTHRLTQLFLKEEAPID